MTIEEQHAHGISFYEKMLERPGDDNVVFGAVKNGVVCGTLGILRGDRIKLRERATVWGVYIDPDHRKRGLAGQLLDTALTHARQKMKVSAVYLDVESTNSVARKLYESRGFRHWGTDPQSMFIDGKFHASDHMILKL